jgi:hypothetical protein
MSWIDELVPLDRPEYATQPEALLTDLLWNSKGSTLAGALAGRGEPPRLVPRQLQPSRGPVETYLVAASAPLDGLFTDQAGQPNPLEAFLDSVLAPRSMRARSAACVPVHPTLVSLQTLHGLVNKANPPSLGKIIETVGWLGGSPGPSAVANMFLGAFPATARRKGFTGFTDALAEAAGRHVWEHLPGNNPGGAGGRPWPGVAAVAHVPQPTATLAELQHTPFRWFWEHWNSLCRGGWSDVLPARRFVDWALCLLRTGLAFSYLWEARFYLALHAAIRERSPERIQELTSFLANGGVLATLEPANVPSRERSAWSALGRVIATGYKARETIREYIENHDQRGLESGTGRLVERIASWIENLPGSLPDELVALPQAGRTTAKNQQEFVRYLLLPRSADDDTADQADFYYLMRSHRSGAWFEPGPEWPVVIASLVARHPRGTCTLGQLARNLAQLGLRVDRSVLVDLLESTGLSSDSPDADDAVLIDAGF